MLRSIPFSPECERIVGTPLAGRIEKILVSLHFQPIDLP
jgi:hypothetical protein